MRKVTYILAGALLILAVGGYLLPEDSDTHPDRILLNSTAGRVVFDHKEHAEQKGIDCLACHHDALKKSDAGRSCKTCHGAEFDETFKGHSVRMDQRSCASCHHMSLTSRDWGHTRHARDLKLPCTVCHHGPQIEETPQNCANCHDRRTDMGNILSLKNAVHTRCASCHTKYFDENSMKGCSSCHTAVPSRTAENMGRLPKEAYTSCRKCHEAEPSRLIPGAMSAYHGLCISCHKKQGGPVDNCAQCHTK